MIDLIGVDNEKRLQRMARLADEIWRQHFTPIIGAGQVEYMLGKFQSEDAMKRQMEQEGYTYLLALDGDEPMGYTGFKKETNRMFLSKLYVKEDHRGQGIGRLMFEEIKRRSEGLDDIYLTVNKHNDVTIAIYRHMGFEQTDSVVTDIGGGFVMDDYIFRYSLKR